MDMQKIRDINLIEAECLGYPLNRNLPLVDEVKYFKEFSEVTERLLCLNAAVACSYGFPKKAAVLWLSNEGIYGSLSSSEKLFIESENDLRQKAALQWQVESIWTLAWCLELHQTLDFSDSCSDKLVHLLPNLAKNESTESFRTGRTLRAIEDIIAKADLSYCLHWAVRDAEIKGQPIPGKVPSNVVIERRRALEWVVADMAWDDVELDT